MFDVRRLLLAFAALLLASPAVAASDARLATLARDVDRVESVRAIKRLQIAWANYVDLGEWDRAAALFTDDAELAHADDHFRGRADILAYFRRMIGKGTEGLPADTIHTPFLMMPVVTLGADGNTAKGRWRAVSMRGSLGGDASWQGGIFENEYVRRGGVWKISRQIFTPLLLGPYATGWRGFRPVMPLVPYDFQPEQIGTPAALGPDVSAAPTRASLPALAGRIQALGDEAAVRNLQDAYGYYVDFKMWDDVVDLFAPRGSISIAGIGTYSGPSGVRRALERDGPAGLRYGEMNDHIQADLIVEVAPDGRHARARGLDLGMIGRNEGEAWWTLTRFDNLFVKQDGKWRFDQMRKAVWMRTPYREGWGKSWLPVTASEREMEPDAPAPATLPAVWQFERPAPPARPLPNMSIATAEAAVWAAAAYDSVENLAGGYGTYLDDNHWDELGAIFAAQGERDSAGGGFIRSPARIASFSRQRYGPYNPNRSGGNMHIRTQPVIDVGADGRTAQIRTRLFQMTIPAPDSPRPPMFVTGMYEDDVVFEDGRWRIKRADIDHLVYAPYPTGWTGLTEDFGRRMTPPLPADAQFDAPGAGDTHPAFPKLPHMWFHYVNPVSGRKPPYLMPKYPLPEP